SFSPLLPVCLPLPLDCGRLANTVQVVVERRVTLSDNGLIVGNARGGFTCAAAAGQRWELLMPIRFRCAYCNQLMGIARRKAGTVVRCPKCAGQVVVPHPEGYDDGSEL